MKKQYFIALLILLMPVTVCAADLAWNYPGLDQWNELDGYVLYFNEYGDTDGPYIKNITKADVTEDGSHVTFSDFEVKCNLKYGQNYDLWITAWNSAGESDDSNIIQYLRTSFVPAADNLPSGTVIEIPNAVVTITVP